MFLFVDSIINNVWW